MTSSTSEDRVRYQHLLDSLREHPSLLIAYSGGLDSTLLAYAAHQALGAKAVAVTAVSPSLAQTDLARARRIAQTVGFCHEEILTDELEQADYRRNGPDRCFFCKAELFSKMGELARQRGFASLAYGAIPEDRLDHRPGAEAARQARVLAPLADAQLDKPALRRLSRAFGLETWDLPAQACLASRIAYDTPVTAPKLQMVEQAEALLKGLGFPACRVRHHDGLARIEVPKERLPDLLKHRDLLVERLREFGFVYVTMDLMGLRSGSMNEILKLRVLS